MFVIAKGRSNDIGTEGIVMVGCFQVLHLRIDKVKDDIGQRETGQYQHGYLADAPSLLWFVGIVVVVVVSDRRSSRMFHWMR